MAPRHNPHYIDPAVRLQPPSARASLLGMLVGCSLIALATWLGTALRSDLPPAHASFAASALQIVDAERALVFKADAATGDVRVLNVRSGVSEIARLHEARRQDVLAMSLDGPRKVLNVDSANAHYEYDAQTFRLLTRIPVLAAGRAPELDM